MKASTLITALAIGVLVTATVLTDTWFYLLMAAAGALFVAFAIAWPRAALLSWLLLAPVLNAYATINLPGGVPDIMFGRVAIVVVTTGLLLRVMLKGRSLAGVGRLELAMLALLAMMMLDLLRSGTPTSDFMQGFDERITPILLFFVARNLLDRKPDPRIVLSIVMAVGCYLAVHGAYQFTGVGRSDPTAASESLARHEGGDRTNESHLDEGRAVGPFTSAVEYGSVAAIAFLGAFVVALYERRPALRALAIAALPLIGAAVVMSSTRSAWLGGFLAVGLIAALDRRRMVLLPAIGAVTVVGVAVAVLLLPADSALEERASALEPLRGRILMYDVGMKIAVRQPIIGYGRGAPSRIAARKELYASGSRDADVAPGQFHNTFLTTLVEWGILALIAQLVLLALIVQAAFAIRRRFPNEPEALYHLTSLVLGATVVFVVQGMLVDTPPFLYLNGVYFFLVGLMYAQRDAIEGSARRELAPSYDLGVTLSPSGGSVEA